MAEKVKGGVVKAAGGLVWLEVPGNKKIALVHRTRYGGEWTLPKGKLNTDEDWKEAALREVSEEIGVPRNEVGVGSVAGTTSYFVEGTPKIVVFYNMFCGREIKVVKKEKTRTEVGTKSGEKKETKPLVDDKSKEKPESEDEVDKVEWVPVHQATHMLRYPQEQALLRDANCLSDRKPAFFSEIKKIIRSSSHKRLDTALEPFELELSEKMKEIEERDIPEKNKKERLRNAGATSLQMIKCAKRALSLCEIELGWRFFFQAELMSLYLIEDQKDALRERALATLNESEEKLSKWRKKTVQKLLGKDGELREDYTVEDVYRAQRILQEHHTNTYIKLRTAQFQLEILALTAVIPIVLLVFLLPRLSGQIGFSNFPLLASTVMLGALGGYFSGIISIARSTEVGRIPDQLLNSWLTISRPIIGAIAALAISVFLLSGLIQLGTLTEHLILATSFAAGFSERLLVKAVESTSGGT